MADVYDSLGDIKKRKREEDSDALAVDVKKSKPSNRVDAGEITIADGEGKVEVEVPAAKRSLSEGLLQINKALIQPAKQLKAMQLLSKMLPKLSIADAKPLLATLEILMSSSLLPRVTESPYNAEYLKIFEHLSKPETVTMFEDKSAKRVSNWSMHCQLVTAIQTDDSFVFAKAAKQAAEAMRSLPKEMEEDDAVAGEERILTLMCVLELAGRQRWREWSRVPLRDMFAAAKEHLRPLVKDEALGEILDNWLNDQHKRAVAKPTKSNIHWITAVEGKVHPLRTKKF